MAHRGVLALGHQRGQVSKLIVGTSRQGTPRPLTLIDPEPFGLGESFLTSTDWRGLSELTLALEGNLSRLSNSSFMADSPASFEDCALSLLSLSVLLLLRDNFAAAAE